MGRPRVEPKKLVVVPDWTRGLSTCGALKTRSCPGLDSLIVLVWIFENEKVFWIGLVGGPRLEP